MSAPRLRMASPQGPSDVLLAPERLYWAVIDLPADAPTAETLSHSRRQAIEPFLEGQLLPPLDTLSWAATPSGERQLLICLAPTVEVAAARKQRTLHMGPLDLPATIRPAVAVDATRLNLLTEALEPLPIVRARSAYRAVVAMVALAVTALLIVGIERRASRLREDALANHTRLLSSLATAHAPDLDALLARQKSLQATRRHLEEPAAPAAPVTLASLLAVWPTGTAAPIVQVESLNVGPDDIGLQLRARSREDATALAQSLSALRSWSLVQPQLSTSGTTADEFPVRASFHLHRVPDQHPATPTEKTP
jgi:Tfp pilus assembly protein PilN